MVGASASAGFTVSEMLGGTNTPFFRLSRYVDAALSAPHEAVLNLAHAMFYLQPEGAGRIQIEEAVASQPTLVIGIDFLFWFCYGEGSTDTARLRRFEKGLKLLEAIPGPLVLGDLPDASAAVDGILSADQLPSNKAMTAANRRLKEWAATRPQVAIVSLSGFMRAVSANQSLTIHGQAIPAGQTRALLQNDKLHPSPTGAAVLALAILDTFLKSQPAVLANDVRWNSKEVYRLGHHSPRKPGTSFQQP